MARHPLDPPSHFGRLVSSAIRRELGDLRMSGRSLATVLRKSEAYARERLKDTYEFTLADVERFALYIGVRPEDFIARIENRDAASPTQGERVAQNQAPSPTAAGRQTASALIREAPPRVSTDVHEHDDLTDHFG